jgi:3-oxoacyl-[acyl-carrier protein] reductase
MFENQNIVVTGGTRGIGAAISRHFLEKGAQVIALYLKNHESALQFRDQLPPELAQKLVVRACDVADPAACEQFWQWYQNAYPLLHVLINNSGIRQDQVAAMMSYEQWSSVINTNLGGTFNMSKGAIPLMMSARYGRIVTIGSVAGRMGIQGQANYSASKAAQSALTRVLAKEVAKKGITVNCVCPGFIETEMLQGLEEQLQSYKTQIPLRRLGQVDEVAQAVAFLASKNAAYITGVDLVIDGGLSA